MTPFKNTVSRALDWTIAAAIGLLAALLHFPVMADYVFPGEIAHVTSVWLGLDVSAQNLFPLLAIVGKPLGASNVIAPICGVISAMTLYHLVAFFLRERVGGEYRDKDAVVISIIGGVAASVVFMFTPAVFNSATHFEPRLFDSMWALLALALVIPYSRLPQGFAWLMPVAMGVMVGMGVADTASFLLLLPLYIGAVWVTSLKRGRKGYGAATLFIAAFLVVLFAWSLPAIGNFSKYVDVQKQAFKLYRATEAWYVVPLFATIPFIASLFSSRKAFSGSRGWMEWSFHILLTVVSVLAVATSLSPSEVMEPTRVPPVVNSAFAAFVAGYLLAYWWSQTRNAVAANESLGEDSATTVTARTLGFVAGGAFIVVLFFSILINRFAAFDAERGAFADRIATMLVDELGGRTWLVTDGSLDDHLRIAALRQGRELHLVCLTRERDTEYIDRLADEVESVKLGGDACKDLTDTLRKYRGLDRKRLVPFIQKWFATDPEVTSKAVVFGAPDLWLYANVEPVPELLFFGGDAARSGDWSKWSELNEILYAPKGWGSHGLYQRALYLKSGYLDRERLNLRRHVGFVATDCGYTFQEQGRKLQDAGDEAKAQELYDKAFDKYELVLNEIDNDNVCALFNELELARARHKKSSAKLKAITARLNRIKEDEDRRYVIGDLGLLYGYICNPDIILKQGLALLLRAGRPGDAVNQIRRALEFVPAANRAAFELNLLASIYARGGEKDKALRIYNDALIRDATNREALTGLARLAMMEGDNAKAIEYLQRVVASAGNDPTAYSQVAMLHLLKNELEEAKTVLRKVTDKDVSNLEAWSMLASTVMRQIDALGDVGNDDSLAARKKELEAELEENIIPAMEKQARSPSDYQLQTTRAFALMRKGGAENLKNARDAFIVVSKERPDIGMTSDMILGLDIQMNDVEDAERQAVEVISSNRKDPLANYVLGSIALRKDNLDEAEAHLRISAESKKPMPMAMNDLAELLRRKKNYEEAEAFARKATEAAPKLYVAWETLGSTLLDAGKSFDEAEQCVQKACDLSKDENGKMADVRMLISLARVQIKRGEMARGKGTLRTVLGRIDELTEFEKREFEELRKSAR